MILNFRLKQFVNNEYFCFDYQLSKIETEELINEVGKDFFGISVSNDSDFIRLELDVLFQDKEMIYKIITLISDMFPHYLKSLKNKPKNKRKKKENLIKTFVEETSGIAVDYKNTILLELDKFFMLYYIIIAKRDTSNINRNITNKLHKIGLNTINFVPFVGKLELTDSQLKYIKRKAIKVDELKEEEQNLFILSSNSFNVQKMTENNPPYYIYLYRKSTFSVKNCTQQYYCISVTSTLEQKGFNLLVDFSEEQENIKLSEIFARCKLFNDLCNSIKILSYKEIFGILTNVYNTSILLDNSKISTIKYVLNNIENKQREFWKFISVYLENINYLPQKCKEYCPYSSSCVHAKTMQTTVHIKKNTIERIDKNEKYVTVEESRKELGEAILSAYNSLENYTTDLQLIIAPPGAGKTEKIIDIIIERVKNGRSCIYAIPNRATIDNFRERLEKKNFHQYIITPTLEKVEGKERKKEIKRFQSAGAFTRLSEYVNKEIKRLKSKDDLSECEKIDLEIMKNYLDVNAQLDTYQGLIITTHHRVSFFKDTFYQDKICFIDEDIFDTDFVNVVTIPLSQIRNVYANSKYLQYNAISKLKEIEDMPVDVVKLVSIVNIDVSTREKVEKELIIPKRNVINIFDFLRCQAIKKYKYTRDNIELTSIKCFLFNDLPPCPVMITSATPEKDFYEKKFYNRKLQIREISKARYKGQIILWDSHTYSNMFVNNEENLIYFEELLYMCKTESMNLITFKDFIEKYKMMISDETVSVENPHKFLLQGINCYNFFSMLGLDTLKDSDLAVIGKPLKDDDVFYFLALLLYRKEYQEKQKCQMQLVEDKGFLFNLCTYTDVILRKIQMWSISSSQEQYVGRGRVYDNKDRIVYLASGYPVEQMIIEEDEESNGIGKIIGL